MREKMPKRETRCPTCDAEIRGNWQDWPHFPFCSYRCRQIDLGRSLGEDYRIPLSTPEESELTSD